MTQHEGSQPPYEPPSVEEIDTGDNSLSTCPGGAQTLPPGAES